MARTIKRQPFTVSTSSKDYPKQYSFVQTEFKGLCDDKNDILVNQRTFSDVDNVYVDETGVLVSRSPFKFYDGEAYIVEDWTFGAYKLRLQRLSLDDDYYLFVLRCITHSCSKTDDGEQREYYSWKISKSLATDDLYPKVSCVEIEDKVFIWFAGVDFLVFNTNAEKPFFEDATKYLYLPVHKQIINAFEYDLEAKNFLTDTYLKRYQYSIVSGVSFESLEGKSLHVSMTNDDVSKSLYSTVITDLSKLLLIYPTYNHGKDYITFAHTPNADLVLRYNFETQSISICMADGYFVELPKLEGIISEPVFTDDKLTVAVFTNKGVAFYEIGGDTNQWVIDPYYYGAKPEPNDFSIKPGTRPYGHFITRETYSYVIHTTTLTNLDYDEFYKPTYTSYIFARVLDKVSYVMRLRNNKIEYETTDPKDWYDLSIEANVKCASFGNTIIVAVIGRPLTSTEILSWHNETACVFVCTGTGDEDKSITTMRLYDEGGMRKYSGSGAYIGSIQVLYDAFDEHTTGPVYTQYNYKDIGLTIDNLSQTDTNLSFNVKIFSFFPGGRDLSLPSGYNSRQFNSYAAYDYKCSFEMSEPTLKMDKYSYGMPISNILPKYMYDVSSPYILGANGLYDLENARLTLLPELAIRPTSIITNCDTIEIEHIGAPEYNYAGNIHLLDDTIEKLRNGEIRDGSYVTIAVNANTEHRYLSLGTFTGGGTIKAGKDMYSSRFCIKKVAIENGAVTYLDDGETIKDGDLVEIKAYNKELSYNTLTVKPWLYKSCKPSDWKEGDPWPEMVNMPPPPLNWRTGDPWPTSGPSTGDVSVSFVGYIKKIQKIEPLAIDSGKVWYSIDDTLWTSNLVKDVYLSLDEYINASVLEDTLYVDVKSIVPDASASLGERYFAFNNTNNQNTLQVTSARRDEQSLDFLLYLSKDNEQKFMSKITALHPLSDTQIGIFTNDAIWYVSKVVLDDATIAYTTATKTRLPLGCRDGDTVITALDGQAIMFPTKRGLAVMAPQDFIATTEKTLTYLSDSIQKTYFDLYTEPVKRDTGDIKPMVKSIIYKHWVIFYKVMDNTLLLLDTRNVSWWRLSVQYPVKDIDVDLYLCLTVQIEGSGGSLGGVSYLYTDMEDISTMTYEDDIVENTVTGKYEERYENKFIGTVRTTSLATPNIRWCVSSQKLHFDAPNNYKLIKGINLNLQGTQADKTTLITKGYRDEYHPVKENTISVYVDEIRNFVYRLNLMHVSAFEYTLKSDDLAETPHRLCLNALTIKYEVKEKIR